MGSRVSREEFEWVYTDQPHTDRRREILGEDRRPVMCARPCAGPARPPARGLRGSFSLSAVRPPAPEGWRPRGAGRTPGRPKARGMGAYASLRAAGPSVIRRWRPPVGRPELAPSCPDDRAPLPPSPEESGLEPDRSLGSGRGPGASPGPGILDHVVQSTAGLAGGTSCR